MPPDFLTAPSGAAQRIAAFGEDMGQLARLPEGEIIWREEDDTVTLTQDGWLVWVNGGKAASYGRRQRATPDLVAELRGTSAGE